MYTGNSIMRRVILALLSTQQRDVRHNRRRGEKKNLDEMLARQLGPVGIFGDFIFDNSCSQQ